MTRSYGTVLICSVALALGLAPAAHATVKVYEGKGVGSARLGRSVTYNLSKLGKPAKTVVDRQYRMADGSTRTVYIHSFGKSMGGGRYPLIMYSNRAKTTFNLTVYSSGYVTTKGIRVGSTETALRTSYPTAKRRRGAVYTRYVVGAGPATEFWVRSGKVYSVTVRR